ncbi:uncharacterized protein THITE_2107933 [Thermothielavioides terrestris NRRL 8126]|uniref:Dienelactone hydrolase domain-containing protein n=1 Tax=Thermothielavioides terrestris (strain ATCC 38088 / NRRL 8126) TaxID=578455 RepID=G2QWA2_THETT|nr:uncharacterized protein THITE_2107933 [Thermothielavioides terrestris NRRL 8126]AEO63077.1 hypothetical protein THITE_2107933 [Thermothielavioides terrestris NRRL 8126]
MSADTQPRPECCLRASLWEGTPTGTETKLADLPNATYLAKPQASDASAPRAAVLMVHDVFGWTFRNNRLLADAYAHEAGADVYLPDFFGGEVVPAEPLLAGRWGDLDLPSFMKRQARDVREPEIVAYARALRARYDRLAAIGFCYGGWAVFRLAADEFVDQATGKPLVDCISAAHPSMLGHPDIEGVSTSVAVQLLAPEHDPVYPVELKQFTFTTLLKKNVPFDYQHFPGVEHGCLVRGDAEKKGERAAMVRGKDAAVAWFRQWLHQE